MCLPDVDTAEHVGVAGGGCLGLGGDLGVTKAPPESKGLIGGRRADGEAVRRLGKMKDPGCVAGHLSHLGHGGVLPEAQLVLAEAVAAEDLALVAVPLEGADLGAGVNGVEEGPGVGVPKLDRAVSCASTGSQEVGLEGAPGDSLDGSAVRGQAVGWTVGRGAVPDVEDVVVAAAGELGAGGRPLEAADLLLVSAEDSGLVLADADIVVDDEAVAAAGAEEVVVPGEGADASTVTTKVADLAALLGVPDLDGVSSSPDGDVAAVSCPVDAGDVVVLVLALHELLDVAGAGVPEVHAGSESDGHSVVGAPVEEVEVVVVEHVGGVKDALGSLGHVAERLPAHAGPVVVVVQGREMGGGVVARGGSGGLVLEGEDAVTLEIKESDKVSTSTVGKR